MTSMGNSVPLRLHGATTDIKGLLNIIRSQAYTGKHVCRIHIDGI
jgi:hypothetical protein